MSESRNSTEMKKNLLLIDEQDTPRDMQAAASARSKRMDVSQLLMIAAARLLITSTCNRTFSR